MPAPTCAHTFSVSFFCVCVCVCVCVSLTKGSCRGYESMPPYPRLHHIRCRAVIRYHACAHAGCLSLLRPLRCAQEVLACSWHAGMRHVNKELTRAKARHRCLLFQLAQAPCACARAAVSISIHAQDDVTTWHDARLLGQSSNQTLRACQAWRAPLG